MFVQTPVIRAWNMPGNVWLKLENCQESGSFKSRGMTRLVESAIDSDLDCHFYSSSGGNAGLAAAAAAASAGRPCTVVVPESTSKYTLERIKSYGAEVIPHGTTWYDADQLLQTIMADDPHAVYCHPFDGETLWMGHSTMIDELKTQLPKQPDAIVLAVGGGGLYTGVMEGLLRHGWESTKIYAVETEKASCFHQSLKVGKTIITDPPTSIAMCLGSRWVPQRALDLALKYKTESILVSDDDAVKAVKKFSRDQRMLVEPACGAALAAVYEGYVKPEGFVVIIVCGGSAWGTDEIVEYRG